VTISFVFRVYVKVITDPWIDHLTDQSMGRNPNTLYIDLGLDIHGVRWPSDNY
jgi:hypothetical protein